MVNRMGTRWRGKIPIPDHCHPLVRKLIAECNAQQTTISEVASRANLRRESISEWRYRRMPKIDNFEAALNAIDLELVIRERRA